MSKIGENKFIIVSLQGTILSYTMSKEKFRTKKSPHWIQVFRWYIEHKNGITIQQLAEKYKCTRKYFLHHFKWYNLPVIIHRNNWRFADKEVKKDHWFFENIDTELKAYLLGLMVSDGNVSKDLCKIVFVSKDSQQCELFRQAIAPSLSITAGTNNASVFSCYSKQLVKSLSKYGVVPRKSWLQEPLPMIEDSLIWHLIRGIFDGDGWCSVSKDKIYESYKCHWGICGRSIPLMGCLTYVFNNVGISSRRETREDGLQKILVSKRLSLIILKDKLYTNSNYYLQRKADKLNFFLSTPSKLERAKPYKLRNA